MAFVNSLDGTKIAYEKNGSGKALILVDGALCYRGFGPMKRLSELLSPHFTVYTFDRRGRGESGNNLPFSIDREIEDLQSLIQGAGGEAMLFGTSSGGCLVLEAAARLKSQVGKLAIYEAPYNSDQGLVQQWKDYRNNLRISLEKAHNGDAVAFFMQLVGTPSDQVEGMKQMPMWPMLEKIAPTLEYDAAAMGEDRSIPTRMAARIISPTLMINGTVLPFMHETAVTIAQAMPNAKQITLEGQSHDVNLDVLAPVLIEFFSS